MSHIKYTVLITGTNRGLGLEFVKQFAIEGYQVIACTRKINKKVCKIIQKTHRHSY